MLWHAGTKYNVWDNKFVIIKDLSNNIMIIRDLLVLVPCDIHIHSHLLNEQHRQRTLPGGYWMVRAWSPLCCHGNVTVDILWNFVMRVTTIQSFSSIQKKSSETSIFCDLNHFVSTMWHHKPSNLYKSKCLITQQPRALS